MVKIKRCYCKSKYQDEKYGRGKRAFNSTMVLPEGDVWRCTVCGKENSKSSGTGVVKPVYWK